MFVKLSKHRDANLWRSQIWRLFFGPASPPHPDRVCQYDSLPLPPPPNRAISREKRGSIYQGLQVVEYSSNQTLAYIGVTKKKLSSICLQRTTCITQGNEARNRYTSKRSQMILEFWNIGSLNLIFFCGQLIQTSFYMVVFGHPYAREGDHLRIRETPG